MLDVVTARIEFGDEAGLAVATTAFNCGFADYKYATRFSTDQMRRFLERSGCALENCAVLAANERGVWRGAGLAILATIGERSWCGGLAVAPELRGKGFGRRLMQAIQQRASELQAQTLALEVLKSNTAAQKLYLSLGYRQVRDLLIWEHRPDGRQTANGSDITFSRTDPRHLLEILGQWQPYDPPWQRSRHAIARLLLDSVGFRLESQAGELLGCVICQPLNINRKDERVRIVGMAVDPRREVVRATEYLLQALRLHFDGMLLTLLNEPSDSCATPALQACDFEVVEEQYEMILHLT